MTHECSSLVLHCIDFRLQKDIRDFLVSLGAMGDCDVVSVAGAAKNLIDAADRQDRNFVLRQIEIAVRLHHIHDVYLINHTDCGAYGGRAAFADEATEREKHVADLKAARKIVLEKFPTLNVQLLLARIGDDGNIRIEKIP